MKLTIDTDKKTLLQERDGQCRELGLYTPEAFELISEQWVKVGWDQKYSYSFSWLGRPIIQLPEDMFRAQEAIYRVKPDVIVETGIAHGGSVIFYASLCKAIGKGRVIGIDIEIRSANRKAIEAHELSPLITLVEGDSVAPEVVARVSKLIKAHEIVMVFLDSSHSRQHVLDELEVYSCLVAPGSYIVAADGIMKDLHDAPRGRPEWAWDNPARAALEFAQKHPQFTLEQPKLVFNESELNFEVTYWPRTWLRREK
jgi:cephalosporin hydroxylase